MWLVQIIFTVLGLIVALVCAVLFYGPMILAIIRIIKNPKKLKVKLRMGGISIGLNNDTLNQQMFDDANRNAMNMHDMAVRDHLTAHNMALDAQQSFMNHHMM